jgi:hypothetical protein
MSLEKCETPCFPSKIATNEQHMREVIDVFLLRKALQKSFSIGWAVQELRSLTDLWRKGEIYIVESAIEDICALYPLESVH